MHKKKPKHFETFRLFFSGPDETFFESGGDPCWHKIDTHFLGAGTALFAIISTCCIWWKIKNGVRSPVQEASKVVTTRLLVYYVSLSQVRWCLWCGTIMYQCPKRCQKFQKKYLLYRMVGYKHLNHWDWSDYHVVMSKKLGILDTLTYFRHRKVSHTSS